MAAADMHPESLAGPKSGWSPDELPDRVLDGKVLMVRPDRFRVQEALNPHMLDADGRLFKVCSQRAWEQWEALRATYEALGFPVTVLPARPDLPDMVFCANWALPLQRPGGSRPAVIMSRMTHPSRRPEVAAARQAFSRLGFEILELPTEEGLFFEGQGDLLWLASKRLLLGGHGVRTARRALSEISRLGSVPVVALFLRDPAFYHLDTCLAPLDLERALWVPEAFDEEGRQILQRIFPGLISVPAREGRRFLAANAHAVDGRRVIIEARCVETIHELEQEGFEVYPVETSEFQKAGGSVFCLKLMLPPG